VAKAVIPTDTAREGLEIRRDLLDPEVAVGQTAETAEAGEPV
jgi:hypothetical protein